MGKYSRETPMSEMDSQRALLDTLMGINRNQDRAQDDVRDWRDKRVCKCFLAGLCPHDLFLNTKADQGSCKSFHSEALRKDFEEQSGNIHMYDDIVEREFYIYINEADRVIRKARQRLDDEKAQELHDAVVEQENPELLQIQVQMDRVIAEIEKVADMGDIDTALMLVNTVDNLDRRREAILGARKKENIPDRQDPTKKLRVCDICGSFLSVFDSDKRLADHFLGKQHLGYQKMREVLLAIKERRSAGASNGRGERDERRVGGSEDVRNGTRDRDRSGRERDYPSRDRDRDRDRGDVNRDRGDVNRDRGDVNRDRGDVNRDRGDINRDRGDVRGRERGDGRRERSRSRERQYSGSSTSRSYREDDRDRRAR